MASIVPVSATAYCGGVPIPYRSLHLLFKFPVLGKLPLLYSKNVNEAIFRHLVQVVIEDTCDIYTIPICVSFFFNYAESKGQSLVHIDVLALAAWSNSVLSFDPLPGIICILIISFFTVVVSHS